MPGHSLKRTQAGNIATERQPVDILGAFVGINRFKVEEVPDNRILIRDAVPAENVPSEPRGVQRGRNIVHLGHANLVWPHCARVLESAQPVRQKLRLGDLGQHGHEFGLHELITAPVGRCPGVGERDQPFQPPIGRENILRFWA